MYPVKDRKDRGPLSMSQIFILAFSDLIFMMQGFPPCSLLALLWITSLLSCFIIIFQFFFLTWNTFLIQLVIIISPFNYSLNLSFYVFHDPYDYRKLYMAFSAKAGAFHRLGYPLLYRLEQKSKCESGSRNYTLGHYTRVQQCPGKLQFEQITLSLFSAFGLK